MATHSKQLVIFDLDGTLSPSKSPIDAEMADLLSRLIAVKKVAILTGGGLPEIQNQILKMLPHSTENWNNLLLLPTSGTKLYVWKGSWVQEYAEHLSAKEKEKVMDSLTAALTLAHYEKPQRTYGDIIEDRGSQITFSAFGQKAPYEIKSIWDPTQEKRARIVSFLQPRIPEFDIRFGGMTSLDITKKGVNKAYGIRRLETHLKLSLDDMLFVGDTLYHGGNDYPAKATGIDCIQVSGPEETKKLILSWL